MFSLILNPGSSKHNEPNEINCSWREREHPELNYLPLPGVSAKIFLGYLNNQISTGKTFEEDWGSGWKNFLRRSMLEEVCLIHVEFAITKTLDLNLKTSRPTLRNLILESLTSQ